MEASTINLVWPRGSVWGFFEEGSSGNKDPLASNMDDKLKNKEPKLIGKYKE